MVIFGLTGSIGMGKSTAASMMARLGCGVYDSDNTVREALLPSGKAFEEVAVTFPECWDKKKHLVKKDVLSDIVFSDEEKRAELEEIIHPIVWESQRDFIKSEKLKGRRVVVLDIPLLFETGAQGRVDYTICVSAPFHIQKRRVLSRPNMDEERFLSILNSQMSDINKRALADFVVNTGMGLDHSFAELREILRVTGVRRNAA
jgi:dephospho-CoA kinase